jgi:hypothetical protein
MSAVQVQQLAAERAWSQYILTSRNGVRQQANFSARDERYATLDMLASGEWSGVLSETFNNQALPPYIKNLVQTGLDDYARLGSAATPAVYCRPLTTKRTEEDSAQLHEAIALTHSNYNRINRLRPKLIYDIAGYGAAYVSCWYDLTLSGPEEYECPYPKWARIDPRTAYPTFVGDDLVDLVVVNSMLRRSAANLFPWLGLEDDPKDTQWVEVIDYYGKRIVAKVIIGSTSQKGGSIKGEPRLAAIEPNWTGMVPVAWSKLDTLDGDIRGLFDQLKDPLFARNTMHAYALRNMEKMAFAPTSYEGILNPQDEGPNAKLYGDPDASRVAVTRIDPSRMTPEYFSIMEGLREETHGAVGIAPSRQGLVNQSIASAAFVSATQGQESTNVEFIQAHLATIEEQLYEIGSEVDRTYLDFPKPLLHPSTRKDYTPGKHLDSKYHVSVSYGLGSGMDPLNRATFLFQAAGTGMLSREYARTQLPGMSEGYMEEGRIEREQTRTVVLQRLYSESPAETVAMALKLQEQGMTLPDVLSTLAEQGYQIGTPPPPTAAPGPEGAPMTAEQQALSMEKGGVPGQTQGLEGMTPEDMQYLQLLQQSGLSAAQTAASPARTQVFAGTGG